MTKREFLPEIVAYFMENPEEFNTVCREYYENTNQFDMVWYPMEYLDDILSDKSPLEIIQSIDMERFNVCNNYVRETVYGFVSSWDEDYDGMLDYMGLCEIVAYETQYNNTSQETDEILQRFAECEEG